MKRLNRRGLSIAAVLASAAMVLASCGFGGDDESADDPNTINFLVPNYSDQTKPLWDQIIKDFEAKNSGMKVNLEMQSWENINDVVRTKLQSEQTTPDLLNIDAFANYANDGKLYPAKDVASESVLSDITPAFAANASVNGTMFAFPLFASTRTLFYNQDLFTQAGIAGPPKTWDELLDAARKIQALGNGIAGYGLPLGAEEAQGETSIWTFGAAGSWGDAGTLTIDTPENVDGVTAMKRMIDEKVTQPNPGSVNRKDVINSFVQGKIGMIEAHPPTVALIKQGNPNLKWSTGPIPTKTGTAVTLGVADHLMAFKKGVDKSKAIKAFLDYFYTPDVYANFVKTENFLPITKTAGDILKDNEVTKPFLATLPDAKFYPSANPKWAPAQKSLQQTAGTIDQGVSPSDMLSKVAAAAK